MPRFEKLRVSLAREEDGPLLEGVDQHEPLTRTEFLTAVFTRERNFPARRPGGTIRFSPIVAPEGYAAGFFSKPNPVELTHEDLSHYTAENYETALFIISLDKAQVIWMQADTKVGSPKSVLESLFAGSATRDAGGDWAAFVRYFETTGEYWAVVQRHRSEITKIIFKYVPPNAFEGKHLAQRYHTAVQEQARNESLTEIFSSAPGRMDPESEMMRANAEIAEQGAGERELRGRGNKLLYKSAQGRLSETVPEDDMPDVEHPSFVRRVITRLFP